MKFPKRIAGDARFELDKMKVKYSHVLKKI